MCVCATATTMSSSRAVAAAARIEAAALRAPTSNDGGGERQRRRASERDGRRAAKCGAKCESAPSKARQFARHRRRLLTFGRLSSLVFGVTRLVKVREATSHSTLLLGL